MTINYYFDGDAFEYDVDVDDYITSLNSEQLLDMVSEYVNDKDIPEEDKKDSSGNTITDVSKLSSDEIADILSDIDEWIEENYSDEIKDYFEDDAKEAYEDAQAYNRDPYGYYGMSQSDFI